MNHPILVSAPSLHGRGTRGLARRLRFALAFALAAGGTCAAHAALPRTLDGSWYNPDQSGHGLTLERVDHDSAVLFWHVFDPAGNPLTLYIDTRVEGDRIVGEALAPRGMRFERFEESTLELPFWGNVEVAFQDCTHATLRYSSSLPGYGAGQIPLRRLLAPKDADCGLADPAGLASLAGRTAGGQLEGLWATGADSLSLPNPGKVYAGPFGGFVTSDGGLVMAGRSPEGYDDTEAYVLVADPLPSSGGEARLRVDLRPNGWLQSLLEPISADFAPPRRHHGFEATLATRPDRARGMLFPRAQGPGSLPDGELQVQAHHASGRPLRPGRYGFQYTYRHLRGIFPDRAVATMELEVSNDLALCLRRSEAPGEPPAAPSACLFSGQATQRGTQFAFVLQGPGPAFTGYGMAEYCVQPVLFCNTGLTMIGDNGETGLQLHVGGDPR